MTTYKLKGRLVQIGETRSFASGFTARRFVVDNSEKHNVKSPIEMMLKKENCAKIEGYNPGELVEVTFSLDGRQWDGPNGTRYYTDHTAWKIERTGGNAAANAESEQSATSATPGASMQTAVETWKKYHGEDKAGFAEFCKAQKPGKPSKQYTSTDWGEIVAKLNEDAKAAEAGDDFDDMPF